MRVGTTRKRQNGATAIEFAFVFPLCFMLFYGSLMYGLIFLMRMGLQHAAEDGARAALRYSKIANYPIGNTAAQNRQLQMQARLEAAKSVARTQSGWMDGWHARDIQANICPADTECLTSGTVAPYPDCSETVRCQVVVTVSYPYAADPVIPSMPGFGLLAPTRLEGRARILFDGRALTYL